MDQKLIVERKSIAVDAAATNEKRYPLLDIMNVTRNSYVAALRVTTHYLDWIATLECFYIHRTIAIGPNDNMIVVDRLAM